MSKLSRRSLTDIIFGGSTMETLFGQLPNPSRLLQRIGKNPSEIYEDMFDDDHIFAVTEILVSGVLRHKWKINSSKESEITRLTKIFKSLPIRNTISNLVYGKLKGMSIFEIVWKYEDRQYIPVDLIPLDSTEFSVSKDGDITYNKTNESFSLKKYRYKFLVYRNKAYKNPYGDAEILKCYYPWQFKRGGWKFWMTTTEKYGVPTLVVDFDPSDIDGDVDKIKAKANELADSFSNIDSDAVVVTNGLGEKSKGITVIEAKAKSDEFMNLINTAEAAISKVIIGTHIIMDGSKGGSRALAEVGANINFRFKVQSMIYDICSVFDYFLMLESELQTGKSNPYGNYFVIPYPNIQDWGKIREAINLGIPVSKKAIYHHVPEPEDEDDVFVKEIATSTKDVKKLVQETKEDTDNDSKSKTEKQEKETREETSVPGTETKQGQ